MFTLVLHFLSLLYSAKTLLYGMPIRSGLCWSGWNLCLHCPGTVEHCPRPSRMRSNRSLILLLKSDALFLQVSAKATSEVMPAKDSIVTAQLASFRQDWSSHNTMKTAVENLPISLQGESERAVQAKAMPASSSYHWFSGVLLSPAFVQQTLSRLLRR